MKSNFNFGAPRIDGPAHVAVLVVLSLGLTGLLASLTSAEVLMTEKAALERAFPGLVPERRTLYLTKEQVAAVEKQARSKLPSAVITVFEARSGEGAPARAVLDTHVVRTMPETVLTVIEPDGRLRMALVLQFNEPPDYLPRERWLKALGGKALDDELWPGRGVPRVTGSTLTTQALTEAVRRSLALDAVVLRGGR
jgi:Na+-translocating ferredoxin:NAD+ oxidoreductase RnfG subunit